MKHVDIYTKIYKIRHFKSNICCFWLHTLHTVLSFTFTQVENAQHCAILFGIKYTLLTVCLREVQQIYK